MKYEDLVKMSVKELKDRLKDLNTQAQAAAGKDLDALLEEATTITGILDDVKNREKLAGIAKDAEGGAEPTGGEKGEEVKDKAREERGQNIKDGKAVKFSAKKTFGVKNALSVSQTVTPTHSAADVKATFTAEGRKKNCIIKLEEIEKISSVHREKNEDNAHFIKNPHIFTYLHRLQSPKQESRKV